MRIFTLFSLLLLLLAGCPGEEDDDSGVGDDDVIADDDDDTHPTDDDDDDTGDTFRPQKHEDEGGCSCSTRGAAAPTGWLTLIAGTGAWRRFRR